MPAAVLVPTAEAELAVGLAVGPVLQVLVGGLHRLNRLSLSRFTLVNDFVFGLHGFEF